MQLVTISIENLRIFSRATLDPHPKNNLIIGKNRAGKTSILEAIDLLSRGKTFRTSSFEDLVKKNEKHILVNGEIKNRERKATQMGIKKEEGNTEVKINGKKTKRQRDLTKELAVQAIHAATHQLIEGGSSTRREYLDWGVFHVEPAFPGAWARYQKGLKQRNALLKGGPSQGSPHSWDHILGLEADLIDKARENHFQLLNGELKSFFEELVPGHDVSLCYQRGWREDQSLEETLKESAHQDSIRGHTTVGPHRADINIEVNGRNAKDGLSRSEQKLISFALVLGQIQLVSEQNKEKIILLIDDLPSELGVDNLERFVKKLDTLNTQTFITAVDDHAYLLPSFYEMNSEQGELFHVEQGRLVEAKPALRMV